MYRQVTSLTTNTADLAIKFSDALTTGVKVALIVHLSLTNSYFWTRYFYNILFCVDKWIFFCILRI